MVLHSTIEVQSSVTALPPQLGMLTGLRRLFVNDNRLTGIPHTIADLGEIDHFIKGGGLDFSNNLLTVLPPGVVARFETAEICWERDQDESWRDLGDITALITRIPAGSERYKVDFSANPIR